MSNDVYILDAVRTPIGRYGGALAGVRPDDLAAHVLRAARRAQPGPRPGRASTTCCFGDANGAGEDNRNVGRMAVLLAGPAARRVPGATVNRLCGSGLEAVIGAARADRGRRRLDSCVAGGVESMSRAPWVLPKPEQRVPARPRDVALHHAGLADGQPANAAGVDGRAGRGRRDPRRPLRHHPRGAGRVRRCAATSRPPRPGTPARTTTRSCRCPAPSWSATRASAPDTTLEALARLKPVFRPDGTVTAGNSSPLNDGAAALLLGDEAGAEASGASRWPGSSSRGGHGVDPQLFGIGPVEAAEHGAASGPGIGWADLAAVELNEAFAAQSLACLAEWPDLDPDIVNPQRRRDRHRPPARLLRRAHPRLARPQLRAPRRRVRARRALHRRRPGPGRRPGG